MAARCATRSSLQWRRRMAAMMGLLVVLAWALLLPCAQGMPRFVFIKTHKTGSSSLAVMLGHAMQDRGLRPALPCQKHLGYPDSFNNADRMLCGRSRYHFTGSISHIRWTQESRDTMLRVMAPDVPVLFTIVRDPVMRFLSALRYFADKPFLELIDYSPGNITETWLQHALVTLAQEDLSTINHTFALRYIIGYGFDLGLVDTYTTQEKDPSFQERARSFIDSLDFVMVNEEWDLSLALLRHHLDLELRELIYPHLKNNGHRRLVISDKTRSMFCKVMWSDCMVHDMLVERFRKQTANNATLQREAEDIARINREANARGQGAKSEDVQDLLRPLRYRGYVHDFFHRFRLPTTF